MTDTKMSERIPESNSCSTSIRSIDIGESEGTEISAIWTSSRALRNWVGGALLGLGLIISYIGSSLNYTLWMIGSEAFLLSDVLFLLSIGIGGEVILKKGYQDLKKKSFGISLLMSLAILGSIAGSILGGVHIYMEGAILSFLFNLAEVLENYSIEKARGSLRELMDLSPDRAVVRRNGETVEVAVESVEIGETVIIKPGEKIPVDGVVIEGSSAINEAPITGESIPVDKHRGDEIYAGTINEHGYLEAEATSKSSESTISKIIEMVKSAERKKTKHERYVERFSSYYTPTVVAIAIVTAFIPPLFLMQPWVIWFIRGITMLVLACPCAFVISTPVAVVSGITSAAKNGVLIESGTSLEAMGEIRVMAFDKTGTLTKGKLNVTDVIPLNGRSKEDVLRCACGLEERSDHPVAKAIVNHVKENHDISHEHGIEGFQEIRGKGVKASLNGREHYAGNPSLMDELGFDLNHVHHSSNSEKVLEEAHRMCSRTNCINILDRTIPRLQREGKTVILVTTEDELEGIIAVADEIRPHAKEVIEVLNSSGIRTVMLTGDNRHTAQAIADQIGIQDFRAELMPNEKVEELKRISERYGSIAMVGDGVNDAPALAVANVGIAMGAAGTDTALETANIALMKDDLSRIPYLYRLAVRTKAIIRQNIFASLTAKTLLAVGVPLGFVSIALAVLAGDAGMTLGITGNAMRISKLNPN
ncbi:MAG: cation-translocating P-type ATPase [Candidatus Thorarchaeota archaeon]|nr:cation-translocating P-type ATPase [Candidatus Thorarchaeota archaeon]